MPASASTSDVVVLRLDSVRERLLKLEEAASGIERILGARAATSDLRDDWAIERGLQLGAEAVLDAPAEAKSSRRAVRRGGGAPSPRNQ